jgi:hypothetical protein
MFSKPNARDAESALKVLSKIEVPKGGDVDGEPLNSPGVLSLLPTETQQIVLHNVEIVADYARRDGDMGAVANNRALNTLRRKGYEASLNEGQYENDRLVGEVGNGDFHIDISDPSDEESE